MTNTEKKIVALRGRVATLESSKAVDVARISALEKMMLLLIDKLEAK